MSKLDPNKFALMFMVVVLVLIAALFEYRLEIGAIGLRFEATPKSSLGQNKNELAIARGAE
ncbi:MAG: hypothetical protein ACTSUY_03135, partial [Alphaproteobacteria bacterium]